MSGGRILFPSLRLLPSLSPTLGAADKSVVVCGSTRVNSQPPAKPPQFVTSPPKSLKVFVACEGAGEGGGKGGGEAKGREFVRSAAPAVL